eukprot:TRINITY_DN5645_c0_g1_i1.p2 TRINITY_DN5645_c0_g1~~TRINITY_DN5645_c0_g1_i1.p2  ORF type:complete len:62 (-),score=5.74 TRINITY_DN5645_c0_g1_i1:146-331(-)
MVKKFLDYVLQSLGNTLSFFSFLLIVQFWGAIVRETIHIFDCACVVCGDSASGTLGGVLAH